jgi:hypothetical protein
MIITDDDDDLDDDDDDDDDYYEDYYDDDYYDDNDDDYYDDDYYDDDDDDDLDDDYDYCIYIKHVRCEGSRLECLLLCDDSQESKPVWPSGLSNNSSNSCIFPVCVLSLFSCPF